MIRIYRQGMAVLLAGLVVYVAACNYDPSSRAPAIGSSSKAERYDGETLFRGIFFGASPVADSLPEIWENPQLKQARQMASNSADALDSEDRIIEALRASDTAFFDRFAEEIQSGNHIRVDQVLTDAARRLREIVSPANGEMLTGADTVACVLIFVAAVAVAVVFVVIFAVLELPREEAGATGLEHDTFVDAVTRNLAAAHIGN